MKTENPETIRMKLLTEMSEGIFSECKKLPRETVLSEKLGISRTQLRDVLPDLEREGFITRRHGVGTVINRHVLQVKCRMDIETEFMDIIRQNGYEAEVAFREVEEIAANTEVADKLQIREGAPVIRIRLLCSANGKPAIYSEDVLDKRLLKTEYEPRDFQLTVFQFLKEYCGVDAYMDLTELHAALADDSLSKILQIPVGTPLLNMEEVDYDIEGTPVFYSKQYFVEGLFSHMVLRKKF